MSLYDFRIMRHYEAQNGQGGMGSQRYGRKGEDLILNLPVGTLVFEQTPEASICWPTLRKRATNIWWRGADAEARATSISSPRHACPPFCAAR